MTVTGGRRDEADNPQLLLTEEQIALVDACRRFNRTPGAVSAARDALEGRAPSPDLWAVLSGELGVAGLGVPESAGGAGGGLVELALVAEELGASLLPSPFFASTVLAGTLLSGLADNSLLADVAGGERTATVAFAEGEDTRLSGDGRCHATRAGDEWLLTGEKHYVLDLDTADDLLVVVRAQGALQVFRLDAKRSGIEIVSTPALDPSRPFATLHLRDAPARLLAEGSRAETAFATMLRAATICLAAEEVGAAGACLRLSVDYAQTRYQFGRPIGSFQAVKHLCADVHVDNELARSSFLAAAVEPTRGDLSAHHAKIMSSQAFVRAVEACIQIHGGIGFTWECDAHLFLRRARSSAVLLGSRDEHIAALAEHLEL